MDFSEAPRPRLPWLRIVGSLLAVGLLIYLLSQQGWPEIGHALRQMSAWRLGLALLLTVVSRFAVAGRWHVLLASAGAELSPGQTIRLTFAGLFASNFLPTTIGGDVVRLTGVLRLKVDRVICLASLVVDRLVGMAGMGMAALALLLHMPILREIFGRGNNRLAPLGWIGLAGGSSGLVGRVWQRGMYLAQRLGQALSLWLLRPQSLLVSLAFTWVHMLCVFGSIGILLPNLDQQMPFTLIGGLWSLTYFITLLPVSINGMGVQELSFTFLFTTFGGLSSASALVIALWMRLLPMFVSLPGALFVPELLEGRRKK